MNNNPNTTQSASQCQQIREWLEAGRNITALEALTDYGCMRLASRITDLRKAGLAIKVSRIVTPSGKYVAQYSLAV